MSASPAVVLVHGVGVGPAAMAPLAAALSSAGRRPVVVHRPGYGTAAGLPPAPLPAAVDALAALVSSAGAGAVVGVSGGATLALALALRLPPGTGGPAVVAHEPLVGLLAPALHARVARAVAALRAAATPAAAVAFVRDLVGEATWSRLDPAERAFVAAHPDLVAAEAGAFAAFAPTGSELAAMRGGVRLTTTVGATSGRDRVAAASVLAALAGAEVAIVPGAGHLAHVDAPDALARLVLDPTSPIAPAGAPA